jgi:hypothetical protein
MEFELIITFEIMVLIVDSILLHCTCCYSFCHILGTTCQFINKYVDIHIHAVVNCFFTKTLTACLEMFFFLKCIRIRQGKISFN